VKLTLPPGVSAASFQQALRAFESVVGRGWVLASDEDRDAYSDIYAPGSETEWPAAAALAPGSVEEVQAIVRLANEHRTPLWPISRGKNLGYGAGAPRMPGTIVLDLGRMDRIVELDTTLGSACSSLVWVSSTCTSICSARRRRCGCPCLVTPGARSSATRSITASAIRPMACTRATCAVSKCAAGWRLAAHGHGRDAGQSQLECVPLSYGPDWTQMFTQSNLGVVTKAGVWLQPAPETSLLLTWDIPNEEDIGWVVDTIVPLKLSGVIDQNVFIPSWLGKIVLKGQRKDFWDKPGAMPESRVRELLAEHKLGYWQVQVRLYGDEAINRAKAEVVKRAFRQHLAAPPHEETWRAGDPVSQYDATLGIPSAVALQMGDWVGGRGAHMGFSPVVPAKSQHVLGQLRRSRQIIAQHDVDFYASFTISGRFATNINMLMYDRDNAQQVANIRKLFNALITQTAQAGYGEYRTHLGWMDPVNATFNFNDHAQRRLNERSRMHSIRTAFSRRASRACGPRSIATWLRLPTRHEARTALVRHGPARDGGKICAGGVTGAAGACRPTAWAPAPVPDAGAAAGG
jgi:4-cresol dehydrogenase (hydroxylating)